ncbi:MAG TPA: ABC transporter ATP-binding protein [Nocardioides bacterium]|nr:ABC transporter ATP-binding protein [Nocardioides sp.]
MSQVAEVPSGLADAASYDGLALRALTKHFGSFYAVRELDLDVPRGSFFALLGPSGCGKTTTLRMVAGLETPSSGSIVLAGSDITYAKPYQRPVNTVFQNYALFPHLDIFENVAFGLRRRKKKNVDDEVRAMLDLVELGTQARKKPAQLSGGQQQRVALARALAPRPGLLLLDEPFSSLDVALREGLAREIRAILLREGIGGLLVSHDQFEAFAFADEIGVLRKGRLLQWDSAYNLYHRPVDRFVADFIGQGVLLPGRVGEDGRVLTELGEVDGALPDGYAPGDEVEVLVRPDDVIHDDASPLSAEVAERAFRGAEFLYTLKLPSGARLLCLASSHHNHALGQRIGIRLDIDHRVMFRRGSGAGAAGRND